jgi:transcriptional regulator with XRE-family HTH domain
MQVDELTGTQLRAARAVCGWSVREVSDLSGIGTSTIKRYETEHGIPASRKGHLSTLRAIFEAHGIQFIGAPDDSPGIRVTTPRPQRAEP